jgi:hypothetical protein
VGIERADQLGHFSMHIDITPEYLTQKNTFEFEIDHTYLSKIIKQRRSIVAVHPLCGTIK